MRNDPRITELITADQIGSVASELERFAQTLRLSEEVARTQPGESLAIYYWTSAEGGLKRINTFVKAADESRRQVQLGNPMKAGRLKARSTAKKSSLEMAIEAKALKDKAFGRKTKKKLE